VKGQRYWELHYPLGLKEWVGKELKHNNLWSSSTSFVSLEAPSSKNEQRHEVVRLPEAVVAQKIFALKTISSAWRSASFEVPRPKALLGSEHFNRLLQLCTSVLSSQPSGSFTSFRIDAAGALSTVFQRLGTELSRSLGLPRDDTNGEFVIAIRAQVPGTWQVAVRATPRPLSTRSWRIERYPGALDAPIAAAMNYAVEPSPEDAVVSLCCGSGTLLIERLAIMSAQRVVGIDISDNALEIAKTHARNAGYNDQIEWRAQDLQNPLLNTGQETFNCFLINLPWGERMGKRSHNMDLYKSILQAMTTLARPGARAAVITQHDDAFNDLLCHTAHGWKLKQSLVVAQGGFRPRIFLLNRV